MSDLDLIASQEGVWVTDSIPADRAEAARATYGLEPDETLLVLHDPSWLGSLLGGSDGFALTDRQFVVGGRFGASATFRVLGDLDRFDTDLLVDGVKVELDGWDGPGVQALLELVKATLPRPATWSEVVLSTVRQELGNVEGLLFAPHIPERKANTIREIHGLGEEETLLAVLDLTRFGTAALHWAFTESRFAWRNHRLSDADSVAWERVSEVRFQVVDDEVYLGSGLFQLSGGRHGLGRALSRLVELAPAEARSSALEARITADPENTDNYAVYADFFEEQGHPRGGLIRAQLAGGAGDAWLEEHRLLLDPEIPGLTRREWHRGFWSALGFYEDAGAFHLYNADAVRIALHHPSAFGLRHLQVGAEGHPVRDDAVGAVLTRTLREVELPQLESIEVHVAFSETWRRLLEITVEDRFSSVDLRLVGLGVER